MQRVLVLSSNEQLCKNMKSDLELAGFLVWVKSNCHVDIEDVLRIAPAVVLFDLPGWDEDKEQVYRMLGTEKCLEHLDLVIVLLVGEEVVGTLSSKLKFDDFLLLPYCWLELDFRLKRALAKKNKNSDRGDIQIGELNINPASYEIKLCGKPLDLTYKEYELLKYLATHRGRAFTRDDLLNAIWGYDYYGGTRTVDVHVRRVRAKLGDTQEEYIKTIRGVGYMFKEKFSSCL